jgi:DNA-binding GntR family transcriptional regulator
MKKTKSKADQAYEVIKTDILTNLLDPGSTIAQADLVERYDFGITPVREALKKLETEGYVHTVPRFGYVITPITPQDVEDIYELRLILETAALRLAVQHASDDQLAQLREHVNFIYTFQNRESYLQFLEDNIAFHTSIALMSGNRRLAETLAKILSEMTRIFTLGLDLRDSALEMRDEHLALASALSARDLGRAETILTGQISSSRQRVVEMLSRRLELQSMAEIGLGR